MSDINACTDDLRVKLNALRDNAAAKGSVDDATIATVMGNATSAAMSEADIKQHMQLDPLLASLMLQMDVPLRESLAQRFLEIATVTSEQSSDAAVKAAMNEVKVQITDPLIDTMTKSVEQANDCQASAKALATMAINASKCTSAERAKAIKDFEDDIHFITLGLEQLKEYDISIDETNDELKKCFDKNSENYTADTNLKAEKVGKLRTLRVELENMKKSEQLSIIAHFDDSTLRNKDMDVSRHLVPLDVPSDLADGKGQTLIDSLLNYLVGRAADYFVTIPYIKRMINDYDSKEGTYWRPPNLDEIDTDVAEPLRALFRSQLKGIFVEVNRKTNATIMGDIKGDFQYGMHDQLGPIHCQDYDGITAIFCLITKYRPQDAEFRDSVEKCFTEAHKHFATGDPRKRIQFLQEKLNEAIKLKIPLKWSSTGKSIAQVVARADPDLADTVRKYKTMSPNDDETASMINRLFAAIKLACNEIDKGSLGKSNKNWNFKAHSMTTTPVPHTLGNRTNNSKDKPDCKNGKDCKFGDRCRFGHPERKSGYSNDNKNGRPCLAKHCKETANQGKKVCSKCFDVARNKGSVQLKDGSAFTYIKKDGNNHSGGRGNKFMFDKAKLALAAAAIMRDEDETSDDEDFDIPAGPMSHKRKVVHSAVDSKKKKRLKADSAMAVRVERVLKMYQDSD